MAFLLFSLLLPFLCPTAALPGQEPVGKTLEPRGAVELVCRASLEQMFSPRDLPAGYSFNDWPEGVGGMRQFCGLNSYYPTVGCICLGKGYPMCNTPYGTDELRTPTFISRCKEACKCEILVKKIPPPPLGPQFDSMGDNQALSSTGSADGLANVMSSLDVGSSSAGGGSASGGSAGGRATATSQRQRDKNAEQCSDTCSNYNSCSSNSCECRAVRTFSAGEHFYKGICLKSDITNLVGVFLLSAGGFGTGGSVINSLGGKIKREEQEVKWELMGCPCNTTYVSEACCSAPEGLVWEAPELKLGILSEPEL